MGLVVRGTTYYLRLNVPKALQKIVGRKELVRSLGTNRCIEAARKARAVAADFEVWLLSFSTEDSKPIAPERVGTTESVVPFETKAFEAKNPSKTLRQVCEIFLSDPTKNRSDTGHFKISMNTRRL